MTTRTKLLVAMVAVGLCLGTVVVFVYFMQAIFDRPAPPYPTVFVGKELAEVVEELTSQQCRITGGDAAATPTTLHFECPNNTTHELEIDENSLVIEQQTFDTRDDGRQVSTTYALGQAPYASYWDE